jgi:hypothetical protein
MISIRPYDRLRIAARVPCVQRTVERVYEGWGSPYMRERIRAAAEALELPAPPPPNVIATKKAA